MTFVSYAQNYEDVMLWRAFKEIDAGFYVDVGANDPIVDSVTCAFYQRGWRGINIEPIQQWYDCLVQRRPKDINLSVAISDQPGVLNLYEIINTGLSTSDTEIAQSYQDQGLSVREVCIPALTLNAILQGYEQRPIHFLKIDVEGAEKYVVASIDLQVYRPWIILIEATKPLTQDSNYEQWEATLFNNAYEFIYFDGLNRFYVAKEHAELKVAFTVPPNVFDDFERYHDQQLNIRYTQAQEDIHEYAQAAHHWKQEADKLSVALQQSQEARHEYAQAAHHWQQEADKLSVALQQSQEEAYTRNNEVNNLTQALRQCQEDAHQYAQSSHHWWTIAEQNTLELAAMRQSLTYKAIVVLKKIPRLYKKNTFKLLLCYLAKELASYPRLKNTLKRQLKKYPALWEKLYRISSMTMPESSIEIANHHNEVYLQWHDQSSLRIRELYQDLAQAIENN